MQVERSAPENVECIKPQQSLRARLFSPRTWGIGVAVLILHRIAAVNDGLRKAALLDALPGTDLSPQETPLLKSRNPALRFWGNRLMFHADT